MDNRVYQFSFDIEAPGDFDTYDFAKRVCKLIYDLSENAEVRGWDQEQSWSVEDYDNGINQF